jgi:hypothetical protein
LRDAVRVVAVGGRRVHELDDDAFDEVRKRNRQGLPILENVAPIALKSEQIVTVLVAHPNLEAIPGAARIAVAATEGERQILVREPCEIRIGVQLDQRRELAAR